MKETLPDLRFTGSQSSFLLTVMILQLRLIQVGWLSTNQTMRRIFPSPGGCSLPQSTTQYILSAFHVKKGVAIDLHERVETREKWAQPAYIPMWMALETCQMCSHSTQCSHPNLIIPAWTHSHPHGVLHGIIYTQSWLGHMLVHLPNIHRCIFGVDSSAFLTTDEFPCESDFAL